MSYSIYLLDPFSKETIMFDTPYQLGGDAYKPGGRKDAWLFIRNPEYNKYFTLLFGELGIRTIYGKTGADSIPILKKCITTLNGPKHDICWNHTDGVLHIVLDLLTIALLRPDGIWVGD